MTRSFWVAAALLGLSALPARACGYAEYPGGCGQTPESEARYMLGRVVTAVQADKPRALQAFQHGTDGFRGLDTYVFCIGPDGTMTAHPNPALQGTNVRDLQDSTGHRFVAEMLEKARPGEVSSIRYLFPKLGGTSEQAKTSFYTRAGDQVCGVGIYDDAAPAAPQPPQARAAALRQRLGAAMPPALQADWTAFLQALDEDEQARAAAVARLREGVDAALPVLGGGTAAR